MLDVMTWRPHVTVAALVERDGRFLVVEEEADGNIVYNQPAGHLNEGESLVEGVARETLEETAWHFQPSSIIGIYRWVSPANGHTYLRVCFNGNCDKHEPTRALDTGILRAVWMTRSELCQLDQQQLRSPMVMRCVDDYLAGKHYPLTLLTELSY